MQQLLVNKGRAHHRTKKSVAKASMHACFSLACYYSYGAYKLKGRIAQVEDSSSLPRAEESRGEKKENPYALEKLLHTGHALQYF